MFDLTEEYFGDSHLGTCTLDEIGETSMSGSSSDPSEWTYVRARTGGRDVMLYSEGICKVMSTKTGSPLVEESVETLSESEVVSRMPSGPRSRMAVPSIRGEYLTVIEVRGSPQGDGTIEPATTGRSSVIPVEYVIEPLSYDEAVVELIDEA